MSEERQGIEPDDTDELNLLDDDEPIDEVDAGLGEAEELGGEPPEPLPEPGEQQRSRGPRTRSEQTIRALRRRAREAEEEARRYREQLFAPRQAPPPQPDPYQQAELERREQEQVSMMSPEQQSRYWAQKFYGQTQAQMAQARIEIADQLDRQTFETVKASNPLAQKYADQVDAALANMRQRGLNPTRKEVLAILAFPEIEKQLARQSARQRRDGQDRIARQTTQPGGGRSTAAAERRSRSEPDMSDEAVAARLKSVTIGDIW